MANLCSYVFPRRPGECDREATYRVDTGHVALYTCPTHLEPVVRSWTVDYEDGAVVVNPVWVDRRE